MKEQKTSPLIADFAVRFKGETGIRMLVSEVNGFLVKAKRGEATRFYGQKTVEEIIKGRRIPVLFKGQEVLFGCYDLCRVLYAVLKFKKLEPKMLRFVENNELHSAILFKMNGNFFWIDPLRNSMRKLTAQEIRSIRARVGKKNNMRCIVPEKKSFQEFVVERRKAHLKPL